MRTDRLTEVRRRLEGDRRGLLHLSPGMALAGGIATTAAVAAALVLALHLAWAAHAAGSTPSIERVSAIAGIQADLLSGIERLPLTLAPSVPGAASTSGLTPRRR